MTRPNQNPNLPHFQPPMRPAEPVQFFQAPGPRMKAGKRQIQMHKFRRQPVPQPRHAAPVAAPPLPPRPVAKPPLPPAHPAAVPAKPAAPAISAVSIRQLIRSRPTALRTIFALSEVLMPPVSMRDENRFG
jgi:hypothetical protein